MLLAKAHIGLVISWPNLRVVHLEGCFLLLAALGFRCVRGFNGRVNKRSVWRGFIYRDKRVRQMVVSRGARFRQGKPWFVKLVVIPGEKVLVVSHRGGATRV